MKRTLVRYKTKPESAEENERLIAAVFAELHATSHAGLRYAAIRLGDGSFIHFAEAEDGAKPLSDLVSFRAFRYAIAERCLEQPTFGDATIVGNYRMLGE